MATYKEKARAKVCQLQMHLYLKLPASWGCKYPEGMDIRFVDGQGSVAWILESYQLLITKLCPHTSFYD